MRCLTLLVSENAGPSKKGRLVEWVEKTSFDQLNRLFEIAMDERSCETLLSEQNLRLVSQEPAPYVVNILPRRLSKKVVAGEHVVLKNLPFYAETQETDAQARQALLNQREEKRQEGTLRRAPGDKRPAPFPPASGPAEKKKKPPTKGIVISTPPPSGLSSVSSDSVRIPGQYGSGPSMPASEWLALLAAGRTASPAGEESSVDQPGSPHPNADAAPPTEETGAEGPDMPPCEPSSLALVLVKGPAAVSFGP